MCGLWLVVLCVTIAVLPARAGEFEGQACLLVQDMEGGELLRVGDACAERMAPCSTFKIANALIGLQTGVLADGDAVYAWDGTEQYFDSWERDHSLATAIPNSVVWYFQRLASDVGAERMQQHLDAFDYGNRDMADGLTTFWLNSSLQISAAEQARFVRQLYRGELPVDERNAAIVRDALVVDEGPGWAFSGKTGTARETEGVSHGWFVGHARHGEREVVVAAWRQEPGQTWGSAVRDDVRAVLVDQGRLPARRVPVAGVNDEASRAYSREINSVIQGAVDGIRGCYEHSFAVDSQPVPACAVRFTIQPDGSVPDAGCQPGYPEIAIEGCLREQLGALVFPPPPGGARIEVSYPM